MIDPRALEAADAWVAKMRGQPGAEIDHGQMTKPEHDAWLDVARETHRQLIGELTPRVHWDLVMEAAGIPEAPLDHSFYSDGPAITFVTAEQAARLQVNKRKD